MLNIYKTEDGKTLELDTFDADCWIKLVEPTEKELRVVRDELNLEMDMLRAATDKEEPARIEVDDGVMFIIVDTPTVDICAEALDETHTTIPLGIIVTEDKIITISNRDLPLLNSFRDNSIAGYSTKKRSRFILQILYRNAKVFLGYLRQIDKASTRVENELHKSMRNKELIEMLKLEKSLVYFSTSLKANEVVMERLMRMKFVRQHEEDTDLLEDVIIENKQAIETCSIYMDILSGTMDAFASVISNNLNIVMKLLAAITIVLSVPTLVASLWGMNVNVPFADHVFGFWIVIGISSIFSIICIWILFKKRMM